MDGKEIDGEEERDGEERWMERRRGMGRRVTALCVHIMCVC